MVGIKIIIHDLERLAIPDVRPDRGATFSDDSFPAWPTGHGMGRKENLLGVLCARFQMPSTP